MPPRRRARARPGAAGRSPAASAGRSPAASAGRSAAPAAALRPAAAAQAPDWLRLAGIQAYGHLGVTQRERELGQRVEADVEIAYEPMRGRRPDTLDEAMDYEEVNRLVRDQIETSRCRLLETLAEEIALALIAEFDSPRVRVRLRKLHVPVREFTVIPEIVIERIRS
ncbi:MAG: dihydroneopterin aldolase [Candidatus Latescibacteria bacterium]|nr:dihydroneopterin aldolase [Candidatus Latescibacterota bacterium]